jgi:hypothetical protein
MSPLSSILSVLALKLSDVKRYSKDDLWCLDRGSGLFAGLNVLPKTAWFSSYSNRVTREMNHDFLQQLHHIWYTNGLLSDTWNLDFQSRSQVYRLSDQIVSHEYTKVSLS